MKYDLTQLTWQEFEVFSLKCFIEAVSPNVKFIDAGSDKGREMTYTGRSQEFRKDLKGSWIFQCKHKSGDVGAARRKLKTDLSTELEKVFVKNGLKYDNYILVTNLTITGDLTDELQKIFDDFKAANPGKCIDFDVFSYRNFEHILDKTSRIIWQFPNVLSHPDFERLLSRPFQSITNNRSKGWLKGVAERRRYAVHTAQTDAAIESLDKNNIIILTGPAKSGKTFNAEMVALYYAGKDGYEAVKLDDPDDVEIFYVTDKKQVFVCDDAFGAHSLSYTNADDWNRKLETIFNLADSDHKFIFSSREYIYNAFKNYAKDFDADFLPQTTIASETLSSAEKGAILTRYTELAELHESIKERILDNIEEIVCHTNFSPESIRAFFENYSTLSAEVEPFLALLEHLNTPDAYLRTLFYNLNENSKAAILAVLCALENDYENVQKKFQQIRADLRITDLKASVTEFEELSGAIIKFTKNQSIEEVDFYHPSMPEFLIREIEKDRYGSLRRVILMNLSPTLADEFILDLPVSTPSKRRSKAIEIKIEDIKLIRTGLQRILSNERLRFYYIIPPLKWLSDADTTNSKIFDKAIFEELKDLIDFVYEEFFRDSVYEKLKDESPGKWMNFFLALRTLELTTGRKPPESAKSILLRLINYMRSHPEFWRIALVSNIFLEESDFVEAVGDKWLSQFSEKLVADIYELGRQQYGAYFPDVSSYRKSRQKLKQPEDKLNTGRTWYPSFLILQAKIHLLKQNKGRSYNAGLLRQIENEWDVLMKISDRAKNRHRFIVNKGWWDE